MSSDRLALVAAVALLAVLAPAGPSTERVSGSWSGREDSGSSRRAHLTADGRFVTFESDADDVVPSDANRSMDVFVRDRSNGATLLVSALPSGVQGNGASTDPVISDDGRVVAFVSDADNLASVVDYNRAADVFVANLMTRRIQCVSVSRRGGWVGNKSSGFGGPSISADGQVVAFASIADDLVAHDHNLYWDVFVRDLGTGTTRRVDVGRRGGEANKGAENPSISADGQIVAFESISWNLVAGDTNRTYDVFVTDLRSGTTELASVDSSGAQSKGGGGAPMLSPNGNVVAFTSSGDDLVPGDNNGVEDVFVHDRTTGQTERVSVDTQGNEVHGRSDTYRYCRAVSSDGGIVGFESGSDALVFGDRNRSEDIFIRVR